MKHTGTTLFISIICFTLSACKPSQAYEAISSAELPNEFSEYYELSFSQNPEMIETRFLNAFDKLETNGIVTHEIALNQLQFHRAAQRSSTLALLLAHDLNGDGIITRQERSTIESLPETSRKWVQKSDLDSADQDKDDEITFQEMMNYSHNYTYMNKATQTSIESYLPLFDINKDGMTTRVEIETVLKESYRISQE